MQGWAHAMEGFPHLSGNPADCPGCYEQYAPCPFCEDGREFEFSEAGVAIWGPDGFWKGQVPQPREIQESCRCYERRMSREEALAKLAELKQQVADYLTDQRSHKTAGPRVESIAQMTSTSEQVPRGLREQPVTVPADDSDTLL